MASVQTLLKTLDQRASTLGWDVVVAYDMASVNALFAQQYVENVAQNQNPITINASVDIGGGVVVDISDLVLGPPLISFEKASTQDQTATVTMNFVAGTLVVIATASNGSTTISEVQSIVPGDQFALTMEVELADVTGDVTQKQNVVVDLADAKSYSANLIPGTGAAGILGQYFKALFQSEASGTWSYQLGTLVMGSTVNLVPTTFIIRTQQAPGGSGIDGAVLLFVAT
jgi:hypothetical protein